MLRSGRHVFRPYVYVIEEKDATGTYKDWEPHMSGFDFKEAIKTKNALNRLQQDMAREIRKEYRVRKYVRERIL